ncbi:hypothetical protein [Cryptosporangium sp. NPDC051539]|uniref:hypothetical protein n=1 Tax=Cryptosporangium sp. NPDC051539 TaxID=3363962 RepID=UPI00379E833E
MSFAAYYADPEPHEHFTVVRLFEEAFTAALPTGGIAAFRSTFGDPNAGSSDAGWYLDLASGATIELNCNGGAGNGGGGPLGQTAESIVYGPAAAPAAVPDVPTDGSGRVRLADVEAWIAAVVTHAAPVDQDGQSWLRDVERYSLRPDRGASPHKYGVTARTHAGGGTFIYFRYATPRGQQPRGEQYTGVPDAV